MELIKINTSQSGKKIVSAKELHEFLRAGSNSNTWFKNQVDRCMLIEGEDFIQILEQSTGGRPSIDYAIVINAAKEISMMNGGDRGKQARMYFIECEKQLSVTQYKMPVTYSEALRQLAEKVDEQEKMQRQIEAQRTAVDFFEAVTSSIDTMDMMSVAKIIGIGRNKLFAFLRDQRIVIKDTNNLPYQQYIDAGYFKVIENKYSKPDGTVHISTKVLVYQRGINFILNRLKKFGHK